MAENETPSAQITPNYSDFDTWRGIIAEQMQAGTVDDSDVFRTSPMRPAQKELSKDFKKWLADETYWNGVDRPQLNSAVGKNIKDALEFGNECVFQNWNGTFLSWLMDPNNVKFQKIISEANAKPELATYRRLVADIMRAVGEDLAKGKSGNEPLLKSNYYNEQLPDTVQYKARMANGQWENIDEKDLIDKLRNPKGPHVIFTANHAFLDSQGPDVDSMGQAFTSLYEGVLADPNNPNPTKISAWDDADGLDSSKTVMVMATNTAPNRFLNLADLFRRLNEIEANHAHPWLDEFEFVSPIAMQTVATILKTAAVEGDVENIEIKRRDGAPPNFVKEEKNIKLADDALNNVRRAIHEIFSKGGNDNRDAMRLLVHTLEAEGPDGKPLITMPKDVSVKDFVSAISMMVMGLNDEPMSHEGPMEDYYADRGVKMLMYTNKPDPTAPVPAWRFNPKDPTYNFDGSASPAGGHAPALYVDGILANWRLRDQQRMAFASTLGKAAITDINFVPNGSGGYDPNALSLEVAPGTTDAMMDKAVEALNVALGDAGLDGVSIEPVGSSRGRDRYRLEGDGLVTIDHIDKLRNAFQSFAAITVSNEKAMQAKTEDAVEKFIEHRAKDELVDLDKTSEDYKTALAEITQEETGTYEAAKQAQIDRCRTLGVMFDGDKPLSAPPADKPLWISESIMFEKLIAIQGALEMKKLKGETVIDVNDPAKNVRGIQILNTLIKGKIHPRVARNLKGHERVAETAKAGANQIG